MSIEAIDAGDYTFEVYSPGVTDESGALALERDHIRVGAVNSVPTPLPVLGAAAAFNLSRRIRRRLRGLRAA
jgi:HAMP domain-containing protein